MDVIDLGLSELEPIHIGNNAPDTSFSMGPGIELLMNDSNKKKSIGATTVDLGELDKLENDLNELSGLKEPETKPISTSNGFASFFGFGDKKTDTQTLPTDSNLGKNTTESMGNTKTWDGFTKINDVPPSGPARPSANLSERDRRRKKRLMLKKLEEWYEKGLLKQSTTFTLDSDYDEIEDEYETVLEEKRKKDSIKLQGWWFMTCVNSIEYANAAFNPFDINLDGWGEQVSEDIESYDEIFSDLYEKYKGGKIAPEISLLLRLGFSAAMVNFTNKALSSATPGFNDVIRQSPELMKMFTNATVSAMSQSSPAFGFANNLMKDMAPPSNMGPPPAPIETKGMPNMQNRGGNNTTEGMPMPMNRPDIAMARGSMMQNAPSSFNPPPSRPEMRGPQNSDIDNILAGLKPRTVDIHPSTDAQSDYGAEDSIMSASSMRDMQNASMPKRSRRRNTSGKNTVSLDI